MGKFKSALYRFMYGRYGSDKLGTCLLVAYIAVIFIQTFLTAFIKSALFDVIMAIIALILAFTVLYRMFSRNIAKRRRENEKFCNFFKLRKSKFKDRKTHVYRKCPKCHATLRLPKARGKHFVVCPRCKHRFSVRG